MDRRAPQTLNQTGILKIWFPGSRLVGKRVAWSLNQLSLKALPCCQASAIGSGLSRQILRTSQLTTCADAVLRSGVSSILRQGPWLAAPHPGACRAAAPVALTCKAVWRVPIHSMRCKCWGSVAFGENAVFASAILLANKESPDQVCFSPHGLLCQVSRGRLVW